MEKMSFYFAAVKPLVKYVDALRFIADVNSRQRGENH
jgi:hypothetical protein